MSHPRCIHRVTWRREDTDGQGQGGVLVDIGMPSRWKTGRSFRPAFQARNAVASQQAEFMWESGGGVEGLAGEVNRRDS